MKCTNIGSLKTSEVVTPYAGVWIEISGSMSSGSMSSVTPYAGVWIEI